jgi:hypothetical protein
LRVKESLSGRLLRQSARSRKRRGLAGKVLKAVGPALPRKAPPREPIFVLGSPRSGTSLVFDILRQSSEVASLDAESHLLWEMFHQPGPEAWSHEATQEMLTPKERTVLVWAIDRVAMGRRYLDKAPRNCLRVPLLQALFPDAWFLHVKRDGRAAVSSLITGWRAPGGMFPGMELPVPLQIEGYEGSTWKFLLPPGWEEFATGRSLEEVCGFQWIAANEAVLRAREELAISRWVEVRYEDLVARPVEETGRLLSELGLAADAGVIRYVDELGSHLSKAVTNPRPDKWREENGQEIERVLPRIGPMMRRLGYEAELDAAGRDRAGS